ncbi:MAG: hypothetical protein EON58_20865, partial [Alphaproteobacteria bacterium]
MMTITKFWRCALAVGLVLLPCALSAGTPSTPQSNYPEGVMDPDEAVRDPRYNDPVFFWRMMSRPQNTREPPAWFYWPDAIIKGDPKAFLPQAGDGDKTISPAALSAMEQWATSRKSNALIVVHKGKIQLERYRNGTRPDEPINGRALTRSVTPMALGFAVADGKVSLDDPIGKFITEWKTDRRGK